MEITRIALCCVLVVILMADVIVSRSTGSTNGNVEALVRDIDERLIASQKAHHRRRRRHVMTQQLAIMEYCLQNPSSCRREVERMRRLNERRPVVIVIEK